MPDSSFDSTELPLLKRHNHCVLVPRDPHHIFAYWDYTPQELEGGQKKSGLKSKDLQLHLRVYDITNGEFNPSQSKHLSDIEVGCFNKSCYIEVEKENSDYVAQLGLSCAGGRFIPLIRSNTAHTPPETSSKRNDLIWQDINERKVSLPFIQEELQNGTANEPAQINVDPKNISTIEPFIIAGPSQGAITYPGNLPAQANVENLSEDSYISRSPEMSDPPQQSQEVRREEVRHRKLRASHMMHGADQINFHMLKAKPSKMPRVYRLTPEDIRAYYLELFAKMSHRGKKHSRSASIKEFLKGRLKDLNWQKVKPLLTYPGLGQYSGSSERSGEEQGASEKLFKAGASEQRLNKRKFSFEVWTELVVHGRTEPDAAVWLNQMGVKLNPDGTFSLRYALVDGGIPLNFVARSSDEVEQRHLYTLVQRDKTVGFQKIAEGHDGS